jgi:hypothetical protein
LSGSEKLLCIETPEYWRKRDQRVRALAADMHHAEPKNRMPKLADDYRKLAEMAEQRIRRDGAE